MGGKDEFKDGTFANRHRTRWHILERPFAPNSCTKFCGAARDLVISALSPAIIISLKERFELSEILATPN